MSDAERAMLLAQIQADEGLRLFPYRDAGGDVTIGWGRNLTAKGLTPGEAMLLFDHDLADAEATVARRWPWALELTPPRYAVLVNMCFNLGGAGLATFTRFLIAVQMGDWPSAALEMRDSEWAGEVGQRAERLAQQMQTGAWT